MIEWDDAHWFKAADSGDHGCVEVAFLGGEVGVRDTKDHSKARTSLRPMSGSASSPGPRRGNSTCRGISLYRRKSSYSGGQGGNCVEVGASDAVLVRDTQHRGGPVLRFAPDAWRRFVGELKARSLQTPGIEAKTAPRSRWTRGPCHAQGLIPRPGCVLRPGISCDSRPFLTFGRQDNKPASGGWSRIWAGITPTLTAGSDTPSARRRNWPVTTPLSPMRNRRTGYAAHPMPPGQRKLAAIVAVFNLAGPGRVPGCLAPATAGLPRESPGRATGPDEAVPGAG